MMSPNDLGGMIPATSNIITSPGSHSSKENEIPIRYTEPGVPW